MISLILVTIISLVLAALSVFCIVVILYISIIGDFKGAPFVRSKPQRIKIMVKLAEIHPGTRVIDLGSGDGSILIEAASHGAFATGIEMNPFLVRYSRWRIKRKGLEKKITLIKGDLRVYPLGDADIIFCYLLKSTLSKLKEKFAQELKPGVKIISNAFTIPGWIPLKEKNGVFVYEKQ